MIQISDNLIAIVVPEETIDFHIIHNGNRVCHFSPSYKRYDIPKGYQILGTITKLQKRHTCRYGSFMTFSHPCKKECQHPEYEFMFDFDCEKYLKKDDNGFYREYNEVTWATYPYETKEESFISLLNSKGILLKQLNNQKLLLLEKS